MCGCSFGSVFLWVDVYIEAQSWYWVSFLMAFHLIYCPAYLAKPRTHQFPRIERVNIPLSLHVCLCLCTHFVCMCKYGCMSHNMHVEVRGQFGVWVLTLLETWSLVCCCTNQAILPVNHALACLCLFSCHRSTVIRRPIHLVLRGFWASKSGSHT